MKTDVIIIPGFDLFDIYAPMNLSSVLDLNQFTVERESPIYEYDFIGKYKIGRKIKTKVIYTLQRNAFYDPETIGKVINYISNSNKTKLGTIYRVISTSIKHIENNKAIYNVGVDENNHYSPCKNKIHQIEINIDTLGKFESGVKSVINSIIVYLMNHNIYRKEIIKTNI